MFSGGGASASPPFFCGIEYSMRLKYTNNASGRTFSGEKTKFVQILSGHREKIPKSP